MTGPSPQYLSVAVPPMVPTGPAVTGLPVPLYGNHSTLANPGYLSAGQQYVQPQYVPQVPPQAPNAYGNSHAAHYMAAVQAAEADLANDQNRPSVSGSVPLAGGGQFGQPPTTPYNVPGYQGTATAGISVPGATPTGQRMAHSYPGAPNQYGYGDGMGDFIPPRRSKKKRKKHNVDRLLEELLAGTALAATVKHANKQRRRGSATSADLPARQAPHGSALGFMHPKGHFVPGALDDMIDHFVHGKRDKDLAPEGAKTGYLHPKGYFVPMNMEGLVQEFKHTLLGLYHQKRHGMNRNAARSNHNGEDSRSSSDSDDSGTSVDG